MPLYNSLALPVLTFLLFPPLPPHSRLNRRVLPGFFTLQTQNRALGQTQRCWQKEHPAHLAPILTLPPAGQALSLLHLHPWKRSR